MEAASQTHEHHHHEMPTEGSALTAVALSATLHCLTGCAIGEITGMVIGTALGFSDLATIVLAVALAFLFGYGLTSLPLLRAGMTLAAVIPVALASDTISIAIMEIVDNAIMVAIPGAMDAGLDNVLFWGALSVALVIAGAFALPANRWLIARGKGHTAVHETGIHGGPPVRLVGAIAAVAAVFGTVVLTVEAISGDDEGHGGGHAATQEPAKEAEGHGGGGHGAADEPDPVRGLSPTSNGLTFRLATPSLEAGRAGELRFSIAGEDGELVRDYEVEHTKRMHVIVVRRDLTGFQHVHPKLGGDGAWTVPLTVPDPGAYRVFADFKHEGRNETLAADLTVEGGPVREQPLPPPSPTATTSGGYEVELTRSGNELAFAIHRDGQPVGVELYLGAGGHLVALRQGDLAYLHTHPSGHGGAHGGGHGDAVRFEAEFPTAGTYRLFLQFKHEGKVRTAAFTHRVKG